MLLVQLLVLAMLASFFCLNFLLWKSLREESEDQMGLVSRIAGLLELSEYDLFRKAYGSWYGREPSRAVLDQAFSRYLREGTVPFYVLDFARKCFQESIKRPKTFCFS